MSGKYDGDPASRRYLDPLGAYDKKDDEMAFPFTHESPDWGRGMSLRDWFAGQAIAGMADFNGYTYADIAKRAYSLADRMLEERTK